MMIGSVLASLLSLAALASQDVARKPATSIESINLEREGGAITAILVGDGWMQQQVYEQNGGRQIIVDIPNVRNPLRHYYPSSPDPLVERILMYEYPPSGDRTWHVSRVVFELKAPAENQVRAVANELHVTLIPEEGFTPVVEASVDDTDDATAPLSSLPKTVPAHISIPAGVEIQPENVDPALFFASVEGVEDDYQVGPEDVLEIRVFELDELNRTVRVAGNGQIDLPLVGTLAVGGLTPTGVSQRIAAELEDRFVQNPQVSVFVQEFNSRRVSLLGSVRSPSTYPLLGRKSLLQLLADAGGLSESAGGLLYVFRQMEDGRSARLSVPLTELMIHGDPRWNIVLRPGDAISVPPEAALSVSIFGAVQQPGVHKLPVGEGATLLKAIALAGGLNERASKRGVQIKRLDPNTGEETILKVNLGDLLSGKRPDVVLYEGDVVVVNESFF